MIEDKKALVYFLFENQTVAPVLNRALAWEHTQASTFWKWSDIREYPNTLKQLTVLGLLNADGRGGFRLSNPKMVHDALEQYVKIRSQAPMIPSPKSVPARVSSGTTPDIFEDVVGYDSVKKTIAMALRAKSPIHLLFIGKASSGKSVLLEGLAKLPGALLRYGDQVSKAGLRKLFQDTKPRYLLLDEAEKMQDVDATTLLEILEHQTVSVVHYGESSMTPIDVRVFAACNTTRKMRPELISRFHRVELQEFTTEEFKQVAFQYLMKKGVKSDLAQYIANSVSMRSRDIRDVRRISDMGSNMEEVEFLISQLGQRHRV